MVLLLIPSLKLLNGGLMIDLTTISLDMGPVFTIALTVLVALLSLWVVRKVIKLSNRS